MNKYLSICIALTFIALCGCGDNKTSSKLIGTQMYSGGGLTGSGNFGVGTGAGVAGAFSNAQAVSVAQQVYTQLLTAILSNRLTGSGKGEILKAALPTTTVNGPAGGTAAVSGSYDSSNGPGDIIITGVSVMTNYQWTYSGAAYKMNGTINVSGALNVSAYGTSARLANLTFLTSAAGVSFFGGGVSAPALLLDLTVTVTGTGAGAVSGLVNNSAISGGSFQGS
jgi:hypothetical protein